MGAGWVLGEVGASGCVGLCDIIRGMYEYDFFTFFGIFLKTMQLHGTTVTKIFQLTHKVCGHFNLYGSLDAVSALIYVLSFNTSDLAL